MLRRDAAVRRPLRVSKLRLVVTVTCTQFARVHSGRQQQVFRPRRRDRPADRPAKNAAPTEVLRPRTGDQVTSSPDRGRRVHRHTHRGIRG